MRYMEAIILVVFVLLGFYFCYDFGYLLTGEGGLGQLFGIPFAVVLAVLSAWLIFTKHKKRTFRILTWGYLLTMMSYVWTILVIKGTNQENALEYLYHYQDGKSYQILGLLITGGASISLAIIFSRNRRLDGSGES